MDNFFFCKPESIESNNVNAVAIIAVVIGISYFVVVSRIHFVTIFVTAVELFLFLLDYVPFIFFDLSDFDAETDRKCQKKLNNAKTHPESEQKIQVSKVTPSLRTQNTTSLPFQEHITAWWERKKRNSGSCA